MRTPLRPPPNPGAGATATLYDDQRVEIGTAQFPAKGKNKSNQRVHLVFFTNVADAIFHHRWRPPEEVTGTLRQLNGAAGETVTANTPFIKDVVLHPGQNILQIVTVTGPTTWELAIDLLDQSS